jgi:hypothetical protein
MQTAQLAGPHVFSAACTIVTAFPVVGGDNAACHMV